MVRLWRRTEVRTDIEFNIVFGVSCRKIKKKNTVRSRFSESRFFEIPFRPSLCAAVKVVSDEYIIHLKCVSLRARLSLFSGITALLLTVFCVRCVM